MSEGQKVYQIPSQSGKRVFSNITAGKNSALQTFQRAKAYGEHPSPVEVVEYELVPTGRTFLWPEVEEEDEEDE